MGANTTIEFEPSSLKIIQMFSGLRSAIPEEVHDEMEAIGDEVRNNIMEGMRDCVRQVIKRGKHAPSVPGGFPAIDTGLLVGSFETLSSKYQLEVGTNVVYAKFLNEGTSKMKARPIFEPAIAGIDVAQRLVSACGRGLYK